MCSVPSEQRVVAWNLRRQREQWVLPTARRFAPTVTLVDGDDVYGALSEDSGIVLDARTGADGAAVTGPSPDALSVWGGVVLEGGTATWVPRTGSLPDGVRPAPTG